jgi:predicted  nucleic acid-binding Zn-ribbon protein
MTGHRNSIAVRDTWQEVDAHLSSLNRLAASAHENIEKTRRDKTASRVVDFGQFEARARQIALLRHLEVELEQIRSRVAKYSNAAEALHQKELRDMQTYIETAENLRNSGEKSSAPSGKDSGTSSGAWNSRESTVKALGLNSTPAKNIPLSVARMPRTAKIVLAQGIELEAIMVPPTLKSAQAIYAAIKSPELYYIPRWNHFAIRVGAVVFHGNIGRLYAGRGGAKKTPKRVKECRSRDRCPSLSGKAPCDYYHNPAVAPGSKDIRNFIATSWLYVPAARRYGARCGARHLGSRDSLQNDLSQISAADARRYLEQTAHDILCSLLLEKYVL